MKVNPAPCPPQIYITLQYRFISGGELNEYTVKQGVPVRGALPFLTPELTPAMILHIARQQVNGLGNLPFLTSIGSLNYTGRRKIPRIYVGGTYVERKYPPIDNPFDYLDLTPTSRWYFMRGDLHFPDINAREPVRGTLKDFEDKLIALTKEGSLL